MFRPDASFPLRFARTVFVPSGPLIVAVVLVNLMAFSESLGKVIVLASEAWFFCSLILVPALLFSGEPAPGSSTDEDGGGGGGGSDRPEPPSRDSGPGGIPLPDAEQSSERVRDHVRRKRRWPRRRPAREPERTTLPRLP